MFRVVIIEAKYPGMCVLCDTPIRVGELITYDKEEQAWVHLDCAEDIGEPDEWNSWLERE